MPKDMIGRAQTGLVSSNGLTALIAFARYAAGADLVIAFEAGEDGLAFPLAADPEVICRPFSLSSTRIKAVDWSGGPVAADPVRLPDGLVAIMDRPVREVLFIATPVEGAERSGILMFWQTDPPVRCDCRFRDNIQTQIGLLSPVFTQMLSDRRAHVRRRVANDRFHDLFGSVPIGIVLLEGNYEFGIVNDLAARLLDIPAGELPIYGIESQMDALQARCRNADALDRVYSPLQHDIDYAATTVWDFGTEQYQVDTHPVLGDGGKGRIWLFQDVTAQRLVEDRLRAMAVTDPLTGLNNRRHFSSIGSASFSTEVDPERPLSALLIDIDHFKKVNDTYGHLTGDEVLRAVSQRMRGVLRKDDLLARIGGEEFAVLLSWMPTAEALEVAERLCLAIAATPVATASGAIEIRASVGVAHRNGSDVDLDQLLGRADRALYSAKNGGRNRVVVDEGEIIPASTLASYLTGR